MAEGDRFGFRLPPFRLPAFFPETLELRLPVPGRPRGPPVASGWVLGFALLIDVLDVVVLATVAGPELLARSFVVGVFGVVLAGGLGVVAVWELFAVLAGFAGLTAFPTVSILLVIRARRSNRDSGPSRPDHQW